MRGWLFLEWSYIRGVLGLFPTLETPPGIIRMLWPTALGMFSLNSWLDIRAESRTHTVAPGRNPLQWHRLTLSKIKTHCSFAVLQTARSFWQTNWLIIKPEVLYSSSNEGLLQGRRVEVENCYTQRLFRLGDGAHRGTHDFSEAVYICYQHLSWVIQSQVNSSQYRCENTKTHWGCTPDYSDHIQRWGGLGCTDHITLAVCVYMFPGQLNGPPTHQTSSVKQEEWVTTTRGIYYTLCDFSVVHCNVTYMFRLSEPVQC